MTPMSTTRRTALVLLACGSYVASQGNLVRIDDSSVYSPSNPTGIQYSQTGWSTVTSGGAAQRYQGTYTQSQAYGSQACSITYYADQPPGFGSVAISLDGANNVNVNWTNAGTTTLYQQNIWSAVGLSTGDHTVVLGNTNINNDTIGLDYFAVTAWNGDDIKPQNFGPGATSVPAAAMLVDNESDQMSYSGGSWKRWYTTASINSTIQAMYFNRTMHCATTPGAVATFRFNGTALWYFAEDYSTDSRVQLSIDGGAGDTVDTATTGHAWTSQKLFWHVSDLSPEVHTFTITHAGSNGDYACVDFLMYLPSSASPNTPTPSSTPPSSTPTPLPASSKSTPVGAIAGGAAGGVALVVLLIILAVVFFKRRSRQPKDGIQHETYAGDAAYHTKPADPMYTTNNLGHGPVYGQPPPSPYAHVGDRSSVAQSAWTGATYQGHPEVQ